MSHSSALEADVVVIGAGAAGCVAAVAAARRGARVVVLDGGASATSMSSGAVDVADVSALRGGRDDPFDPGGPYAEGVDTLADQFPSHPYARIGHSGRARLEEALVVLREVAADAELSPALDPGLNMVLVTSLGTTKRAALAQGSQAAGQLARFAGGRLGVGHFRRHYDLDGRVGAAILHHASARAHPRRRIEVCTIDIDFLRRERDAHLSAIDLARLFEARDMTEALGRAIDRSLSDVGAVDCLLVPAVVGLDRAFEVYFRLQGQIGLSLAEICMLPPSPPGWRLDRALRRGLVRDGVEVIKARARTATLADPRVVSVDFLESGARDARLIRARSVVLAAGHLASRGVIVSDRPREPLCDLPLWVDGAPLGELEGRSLLAERFDGAHPLLRTGVAIDEQLRPLAEDGRSSAHPRLFAAGALLGGNDPGVHKAGIGLCALTGLLAGRAAAEAAALSLA